MHISIYGVGRSGTKAIQLYLSYLLARKEGKVWINYEPYFWLDRKTNLVNYEGFYHHSTSPHLCRSTKEFSPRHRHFIKQLSKQSGSTVTKFIRGNGRICAINEILQPDHNIVVVRDLYEVLFSVLKMPWDFWSVGFEFTISWEKFLKDVRDSKLIDNYDWCVEQMTDRIDQNAFYWYFMNLCALEYSSPGTFYLNYKNIQTIEPLARKIIDPSIVERISDDLFNGEYLHGDYPLMSNRKHGFSTDLINTIAYKSQLMQKYGLYLPYRYYGSSAVVNQDYELIESVEVRSTKVGVTTKDIFEFFRTDIEKRMAEKEIKSV